MKIFTFILSSLLFIMVFFIIYTIHISHFKVDVVLYSALIDDFLAIAFMSILFCFTFHIFTKSEKIMLLSIWFLSGYAFVITVPTVLDRSLSFYLLEKLQQRGGGIKQDSFDKVFHEEYMLEHRLIDIRLTEQLISGTIKINEGCVLLTSKGQILATFSRYFRQNWLPKNRLIAGEYTDELTDPFRESKKIYNYQCQ
jgi:hypothetical protein